MLCWIIQPVAYKHYPPQKLDPPFQIPTRQTPPFSKSFRVIRPPPKMMASDIPVDAVKSHIASGSVDDGFLVVVDGSLLQTSAKSKVEPVVEPVLGKVTANPPHGTIFCDQMENNEYPCDTMKSFHQLGIIPRREKNLIEDKWEHSYSNTKSTILE
ncbi:hypothetical protein BYT27DRAFT_7200772 [Phlegmacium glaucopus]|nr:hypothetical protein BYT27DRAFT_7200772 [Phlegmacium glaucopus]